MNFATQPSNLIFYFRSHMDFDLFIRFRCSLYVLRLQDLEVFYFWNRPMITKRFSVLNFHESLDLLSLKVLWFSRTDFPFNRKIQSLFWMDYFCVFLFIKLCKSISSFLKNLAAWIRVSLLWSLLLIHSVHISKNQLNKSSWLLYLSYDFFEKKCLEIWTFVIVF